MSKASLNLILTRLPDVQITDAEIGISIELRNVSEHPVLIVRALEGSDTGLRFPQYLPEINGERPPLSDEIEFLDVVAPLRPKDFHLLSPGQSFNPVAEINPVFNPLLAAFIKFAPRAPGRYQLQMTFSTASESENEWLGMAEYPDKDEVLRRLIEVPRLQIKSNILSIEAK